MKPLHTAALALILVLGDCFTVHQIATQHFGTMVMQAKKKGGTGKKRGFSRGPSQTSQQPSVATSVDDEVADLEIKLAELKAKQADEQAAKLEPTSAPPLPPLEPAVSLPKVPESWPPPPPEPAVPYYEDADPAAVGHRLDTINNAIELNAASIVQQLKNRGVFVVDGLLGSEACAKMRAEAEALHRGGLMAPSQSSTWDEEAGAEVTYDKHQVLSMQILGGQAQYSTAPRLVEYTVGLTESLAPVIAAAFPNTAPLNPRVQSNKLAVCLGDGSEYDQHVDNSVYFGQTSEGSSGGVQDLRKLTVLYYLNQEQWDSSRGGAFIAFGVPGVEARAATASAAGDDSLDEGWDIPPLGDRLLGFWSDELKHQVEPSWAPNGPSDYRYALTVWLCVDDPKYIGVNDAPAWKKKSI